jgi:ATP-binding cassette subfamily A (ABC1) protein 3
MKPPNFLRSRIVRQSIALTRKNFLIFYKSPITTIIRALIFPIVVALVLTLLKYVLATSGTSSSQDGTASSANALRDIASALDTAPGLKLVFVRNGLDTSVIDPVINGVIGEIGNRGSSILDDPNDLFNECPQSLNGRSDCFAAVIFTNFNATNVDYIM